MTEGEKQIWRCVFAAHFVSPATINSLGAVSDEIRARAAIRCANRALEALREESQRGDFDSVTEVRR